MKKHSNNGMIFLGMFFMLFTGFILGMIVIHLSDQKREQEKITALKQEMDKQIEEAKESVSVYIPARNIKPGEMLRNSYNPDNFVIEDGFMAYYNDEGEKISHVGVDLSYHNDKVNWDELANSPVEFVMLRCGYRGYTEGGIVNDEKFEQYAKAANEHGLKLGVYFFTQAITEEEAIVEAEHVIKLIEDYDISYPVAFDTELIDDEEARTNQADLSKEDLSKICIAFCERIKEAGYYPMIYASENWCRRRLDMTMLTDYDFWAPQYLEENDFIYDFTIWQYTESGAAPGIEGPCDLNVSMVDYASFVPALLEAKKNDGVINEYNPDAVSQNPSITVTPIDNNY